MNPLTQPKNATILPVLIALTLCGFSVSADAQCVTAPDDLVHWWTADGDTFDIIGDEHGILRNGATFGTGEVAQAFSLDGTDDFVEVPNDPAAAFNFTGAFTIDAWIFLDAYPPEFSPIVSKWNDIPFGNENRTYFLAIDVNQTAQPRLRFDVSRDGHFGGTSSARTLSNTTIPTGQWLHVAGVFDPAQSTVTQRLKVYVNGVNVSGGFFIPSQVTSVFVNQEPLLIGAGDLGSNVRDFFDGRIDEVELFDRALTQTEINSIFQAGSSGKVIPIVIDIKPGEEPNSINLGSKGSVPVAILSTETFDATSVDLSSVRFAGAPIRTKHNGTFQASFEDVNGNGLLDLVAHFETHALDLDDTSTEATLTGIGGMDRCIAGTDSVNIVP